MNSDNTQLRDPSKTSLTPSPMASTHPLKLTPSLALAAALLYMMLQNGRVSQIEIERWKAIIGRNRNLVRYSVEYVQSIHIDDFVKEASNTLDSANKLCILVNMCDSMLSDGSADVEELDLLSYCMEEFGIRNDDFHPFFETIRLKNNSSVLGIFPTEIPENFELTPYLAWTLLMIYVVAADGSIGSTEFQRLHSIMGDFSGLLNTAVKHALVVKSDNFFSLVSDLLNEDQKIFVLINAYDLILSDGAVDVSERTAFEKILVAFGYSDQKFSAFHSTIKAKNLKRLDIEEYIHTKQYKNDSKSEIDLEFEHSDQHLLTALEKRHLSIRRVTVEKIPARFVCSKKLNRIAIIVSDSCRENFSARATESFSQSHFETHGIFSDSATTDAADYPGGSDKQKSPTISPKRDAHDATPAISWQIRAENIRNSIESVDSPQVSPDMSPLKFDSFLPDWCLAVLVFLLACTVFFTLLFIVLSQTF